MLTMLIGNIASGKSSFTDKIVTDSDYVVDKDSYRDYYGGVSDKPYVWDEKLEVLIHKMVVARVEAILLVGGWDVILDETFMSRSSRSPFIALAEKYGHEIRGILFQDYGEDEHVRRRMQHDSRGYSEERWREVYRYKQKRWEFPTISEGFDLLIPSW